MKLPQPLSGALALLAALTLAACGGGADEASTPSPQTQAQAPRTAPEMPVVRTVGYAASGAGSYREALENHQKVGEAIHEQR